MSPDAFAAILIACKGKASITLFMPGIDPDEGLDVDPDSVMLARDHPLFGELADSADADYLWLSAERSTTVGVGALKVELGGPSTLFDVRHISAIDYR